jgi:hypothetical protein
MSGVYSLPRLFAELAPLLRNGEVLVVQNQFEFRYILAQHYPNDHHMASSSRPVLRVTRNLIFYRKSEVYFEREWGG